MKFKVIFIIILFIVLAVFGYNKIYNVQDTIKEQEIQDTVKEHNVAKVGVNLQKPDVSDLNYVSILDEYINIKYDSGSKKIFSISLKSKQDIMIKTNSQDEIKIEIKNSDNEITHEYRVTPKDGKILLDKLNAEGTYQLSIDFEKSDIFEYGIYIIN